LNREKREESCPRRVVGEGLAETDETWFGRCLRMPGTFLQGIQILGLHTNEGVTDQNQRIA
jgi:hypothetical protein